MLISNKIIQSIYAAKISRIVWRGIRTPADYFKHSHKDNQNMNKEEREEYFRLKVALYKYFMKNLINFQKLEELERLKRHLEIEKKNVEAKKEEKYAKSKVQFNE